MRNRFAAVITVVAIATSAYAQTPASIRLPAAAESHRRHARRAAAADCGSEPGARCHRAARTGQHADHRRALAADLSARRRPHQSANQRATPRPALSQPDAEGDCRRQRAERSRCRRRRSSTWIGFYADGKRFAFTNMRDNGVELWIGDTATGQAKSITPAQLNSVFGVPCSFVGEGTSLLCAFVNANRGAAPAAPSAPTGPNVQESRGVVALGGDRAGHARQRARREPLRVLRHEPARARRRQPPASARRSAVPRSTRTSRRRPTAISCSSPRSSGRSRGSCPTSASPPPRRSSTSAARS